MELLVGVLVAFLAPDVGLVDLRSPFYLYGLLPQASRRR